MSNFEVNENFECGNITILKSSDGFFKLSPRAKEGEHIHYGSRLDFVDL